MVIQILPGGLRRRLRVALPFLGCIDLLERLVTSSAGLVASWRAKCVARLDVGLVVGGFVPGIGIEICDMGVREFELY